MLNLELGSHETVDGRSCILTPTGALGHALYGPYEQLQPGDYLVGFRIEQAGAGNARAKDLLAVIDISADSGKQLLARHEIRAADLAKSAAFTVPFSIDLPCRAEYHVWVSGKVPLLIEDNRPAVAANGRGGTASSTEDAHFPDAIGQTVPFFVAHREQLRALFDRGIVVRIVDGEVRLAVDGITLHARCADDLAFVGELFLDNAYNFRLDRPTLVVDVGMNIGLATLHFAGKAEVAEVHSFEPFPETYDRAVANIALNPALAAKIRPMKAGLSDADFSGPILVPTHDCSGAMTTIGVIDGRAVDLVLRDAGAALVPIVDDAEARGLEVVVKVDCEGSEFQVFESIEQAGLLPRIRAFLVEWHSMFDGKTQETLTAPLRRAGYLIFDRSPPNGNGFFYAARIG